MLNDNRWVRHFTPTVLGSGSLELLSEESSSLQQAWLGSGSFCHQRCLLCCWPCHISIWLHWRPQLRESSGRAGNDRQAGKDRAWLWERHPWQRGQGPTIVIHHNKRMNFSWPILSQTSVTCCRIHSRDPVALVRGVKTELEGSNRTFSDSSALAPLFGCFSWWRTWPFFPSGFGLICTRSQNLFSGSCRNYHTRSCLPVARQGPAKPMIWWLASLALWRILVPLRDVASLTTCSRTSFALLVAAKSSCTFFILSIQFGWVLHLLDTTQTPQVTDFQRTWHLDPYLLVHKSLHSVNWGQELGYWLACS